MTNLKDNPIYPLHFLNYGFCWKKLTLPLTIPNVQNYRKDSTIVVSNKTDNLNSKLV